MVEYSVKSLALYDMCNHLWHYMGIWCFTFFPV